MFKKFVPRRTKARKTNETEDPNPYRTPAQDENGGSVALSEPGRATLGRRTSTGSLAPITGDDGIDPSTEDIDKKLQASSENLNNDGAPDVPGLSQSASSVNVPRALNNNIDLSRLSTNDNIQQASLNVIGENTVLNPENNENDVSISNNENKDSIQPVISNGASSSNLPAPNLTPPLLPTANSMSSGATPDFPRTTSEGPSTWGPLQTHQTHQTFAPEGNSSPLGRETNYHFPVTQPDGPLEQELGNISAAEMSAAELIHHHSAAESANFSDLGMGLHFYSTTSTQSFDQDRLTLSQSSPTSLQQLRDDSPGAEFGNARSEFGTMHRDTITRPEPVQEESDIEEITPIESLKKLKTFGTIRSVTFKDQAMYSTDFSESSVEECGTIRSVKASENDKSHRPRNRSGVWSQSITLCSEDTDDTEEASKESDDGENPMSLEALRRRSVVNKKFCKQSTGFILGNADDSSHSSSESSSIVPRPSCKGRDLNNDNSSFDSDYHAERAPKAPATVTQEKQGSGSSSSSYVNPKVGAPTENLFDEAQASSSGPSSSTSSHINPMVGASPENLFDGAQSSSSGLPNGNASSDSSSSRVFDMTAPSIAIIDTNLPQSAEPPSLDFHSVQSVESDVDILSISPKENMKSESPRPNNPTNHPKSTEPVGPLEFFDATLKIVGETIEAAGPPLQEILFGGASPSKKIIAFLSEEPSSSSTTLDRILPPKQGPNPPTEEVAKLRAHCDFLDKKVVELTEKVSRLNDEGTELRRINGEQVLALQDEASNDQKVLHEQVHALHDVKTDLYRKLQTAESNLLEALETQKQELSDNSTCCLCMENAADVVFFHCRHMCCCKECAVRVRDCPLCRQTIEHRVAVYLK